MSKNILTKFGKKHQKLVMLQTGEHLRMSSERASIAVTCPSKQAYSTPQFSILHSDYIQILTSFSHSFQNSL